MKNTIFAITVIALMLLAGCSKEEVPAKKITTFEECEAAGNPIMESYPRQCAADGKTFTETIATPPEPPIVGGDRDEHGCIGSAGYIWCEAKQECLREWEEPCEEAAEEEPAEETPSEQEPSEPTNEDRAGEIAKAQIEGMTEYTGHNGRNIVVRNVQTLRCPGCFDVEVYFERDSVINPGGVTAAIMHVTLDRWKVKDVTALYDDVSEPEGCKDNCGDGQCAEVVCMALGCPCAETPENCPEDCA
jgi:hypothetical protein